MAGEILRISLKNQTVNIGDKVHPILPDKIPPKPNTRYKIFPYSFCDSESERSNVSVFEILPFGSTSIMEITDPNLLCQRIAVEGSGYCLRLNLNNPNHRTEVYPIDAGQEENPLIELSSGWVECFIAGKDGLKIAEVSTPKFTPSIGSELSLYDSRLTAKFTDTFLKLCQDEMIRYVHEYPISSLERTLEYYRMIGATPEDILIGHTNQTTKAELMTDEQITDEMKYIKETAISAAKTIEMNPGLRLDFEHYYVKDYPLCLKYLAKIGRLPEGCREDYQKELEKDSSN
jgi:hypothetical protein